MRYAFLAMVAVYLITFFGCSPEDQKTDHNSATVSEQHVQKEAAPNKEPEQQAENNAADNRDKVADTASQNVLAVIAEDQDKEPSAEKQEEEFTEKTVEIKELVDLVNAQKMKKEGIQEASVHPQKPKNTEELAEAFQQMESATRELVQLAGALILENQQLKNILTSLTECPAYQGKACDKTAPHSECPKTACPRDKAVEKDAANTKEKLQKAIDNVGSSAQNLTTEAADTAKQIIAEHSIKAKEVAKELTEKAVQISNAALDSAKTVVNQTGEVIIENLAPATENKK